MGVAILGGTLNVGVNALTRENYDVLSTRALADFTIGASFGVAAYGTGALLTSANVARALGVLNISNEVWIARVAFTSRVLALGDLTALESFITAKSYGDPFGGYDARYAFLVGLSGGIVGEAVGWIGKGAEDELTALANEQIVRAGERIQIFERSALQTMRFSRTSWYGRAAYPVSTVDRLIRRRQLLFNDLQRAGQLYPAGWESFIKTSSFLGVTIYGDSEYYPLLHQLMAREFD